MKEAASIYTRRIPWHSPIKSPSPKNSQQKRNFSTLNTQATSKIEE
jgi:hypothetical protein